MKTLAAIILAAQPTNLLPVRTAQNAPQVQQIHLDAHVPTYCHFGDATPVTADAMTMRISCNVGSVMYLRLDERDYDKILPLYVSIGGRQAVLITKENIDRTPIGIFEPYYGDIRIHVQSKGGRPTVLPRLSFVVRPIGY